MLCALCACVVCNQVDRLICIVYSAVGARVAGGQQASKQLARLELAAFSLSLAEQRRRDCRIEINGAIEIGNSKAATTQKAL